MKSLGVMMLSACALLWAVSDGSAQVAQPVPPVARVSGDTFTNPLMQNGPDPWVIWWKGFYDDPIEGTWTFKGKISDSSDKFQRFTWNPDGRPNFGRPVPLDQPLEKPAR